MTVFNFKNMTTYQVTFRSQSASNAVVLFASGNLQESEDRFEKEDFTGYFSEELHSLKHDDDCSEIELKKFVDGELTDFEENESRLSEKGGWIIKAFDK